MGTWQRFPLILLFKQYKNLIEMTANTAAIPVDNKINNKLNVNGVSVS